MGQNYSAGGRLVSKEEYEKFQGINQAVKKEVKKPVVKAENPIVETKKVVKKRPGRPKKTS